jgi:hypothetical protein
MVSSIYTLAVGWADSVFDDGRLRITATLLKVLGNHDLGQVHCQMLKLMILMCFYDILNCRYRIDILSKHNELCISLTAVFSLGNFCRCTDREMPVQAKASDGNAFL